MWKCKSCGGTDMYGVGSITGGSWRCTPPTTGEERYGDCEIDDWDGPIDEWICNDCGSSGNTIDDIAEWEDDK